jgi:probable F420-dependent oxidoreductase
MKLSWAALGDAVDLRGHVGAMERAGYDTLLTAELAHDAFIRAAIMAGHTERAEIMTSIAVAFARTPMLLAMAAHDLNVLSRGRFVMGLGSQVKAHVTRRFSMPWSSPAARMREMILAVRAIWDCWHDGAKLDFRGEFYSHTLMTPMFSPKDLEFGRPRIQLAAVGPQMTQVAGEVADGMICHAFSTERYLREAALPALEAALQRAGRPRRAFEISMGPHTAIGDTEEELAAAVRATKKQIAFYASTPAYRPVLELHGWEALQDELHVLSRQDRWDEMAGLIEDEVLDTLAVVGSSREVAVELGRRYHGLLDRMSIVFPGPAEQIPELLDLVRRSTRA